MDGKLENIDRRLVRVETVIAREVRPWQSTTAHVILIKSISAD